MGFPSVLVTSYADAYKVFDGMSCHEEAAAVYVLHVTVSHMLYAVSEEVMHQLFDPYGAENVQLLLTATQVEALISFHWYHDAMRARNALNGSCIWDNCCRLDIQYVRAQPMQTNSPQLDAKVEVDAPVPTTCSTLDQGIDDSANHVGVLLQPGLQVFSVVQPSLESSLGTPQDQRIALPGALAHELRKNAEGTLSNSETMLMGSGKLLQMGNDILELNGDCKEAVGGIFSSTSETKKDGLFLCIGEPGPPPNPLQILRVISGDHRVFDRGKYFQFLSWPIFIVSNNTSVLLSGRNRLLWMIGECVATLTEMRQLSRHQALQFSDMLMLLIVRKWGPDTPYIYRDNLAFQIGDDLDVVPTRTNVQILIHSDTNAVALMLHMQLTEYWRGFIDVPLGFIHFGYPPTDSTSEYWMLGCLWVLFQYLGINSTTPWPSFCCSEAGMPFLIFDGAGILLLHVTSSGWLQMFGKAVKGIYCENHLVMFHLSRCYVLVLQKLG
ncbi:hypothetical protein BS78_10G148000 [Paspalum vaginatum]|nr:hypothetical protein BS78_10G148000 [Paspalum vaginatum]